MIYCLCQMEHKYSNNSKPLNRALGQRSKVEILRYLVSCQEPLSGRELARRCGLSHLAVQRALHDLEAEGLIDRRIISPNHQFRLNREHWLASSLLIPLFEKERLGLCKLKETLLKGLPAGVGSVIVYGSFVRGLANSKSDIDVLVLIENTNDKKAIQTHFQKLSPIVYALFHQPLSVVILGEREFGKMYKEQDPFAREISYFGQSLYGKLVTEVLFENGAKKN